MQWLFLIVLEYEYLEDNAIVVTYKNEEYSSKLLSHFIYFILVILADSKTPWRHAFTGILDINPYGLIQHIGGIGIRLLYRVLLVDPLFSFLRLNIEMASIASVLTA